VATPASSPAYLQSLQFGMALSEPVHWVESEILSRGITRLCHFTPLTNLDWILKEGAIWDRRSLEGRNSTFSFNDPDRLDGHLGHVCLTVEHPNVFVMDGMTTGSPGKNFVVLCVKPTEMGRAGVLFSRVNAATGSGSCLEEGRPGFESMYARRPSWREFFRGSNHAVSCPTDLQAEVLIPGPIWLESVLGIVVASADTGGRVLEMLADSGRGMRVVLEPNFFSRSVITSSVWRGDVIGLPGI
jgi:hypothetical protein